MIKSHMIPQTDVQTGENDETKKRQLVENYINTRKREIHPTISGMTRILSKAPAFYDRQDDEILKTDILFIFIAYGFQPEEYVCFDLEHKTLEQKNEWISDLERYIYIHTMNDIKGADIFNNKARTYQYFGNYYRRDAIEIRNEADYK